MAESEPPRSDVGGPCNLSSFWYQIAVVLVLSIVLVLVLVLALALLLLLQSRAHLAQPSAPCEGRGAEEPRTRRKPWDFERKKPVGRFSLVGRTDSNDDSD